MNYYKHKIEFYKLVKDVVSIKGDEWFNAWSKANPIDDYICPICDDELSDMIIDPAVTNITFVNYIAMKEKLEADMHGH